MKLIAVVILTLSANLLMAADLDLQGKLPEDFDWVAYLASGDQSTAGQMFQAEAAVVLLQGRMDAICAQYRALLTKRGEARALTLFDEMQRNWQKAADAEIELVGSAWEGGSGAKAAFPRQRFKIYLRRVKELKELKADCLFLNE